MKGWFSILPLVVMALTNVQMSCTSAATRRNDQSQNKMNPHILFNT